MKIINIGDKVKYTGANNTWTFEQDLLKNCLGSVFEVKRTGRSIHYLVEFENGLKASILGTNLQLMSSFNPFHL
jgi:hypothetical protein